MDRKRISRNGAVVGKDKCRSRRRVKDDALDVQWNALGDFNPYEGETFLNVTWAKRCILVYPDGFKSRKYLMFDASAESLKETSDALREYNISVHPSVTIKGCVAMEPDTSIGGSCVLSYVVMEESSRILKGCTNDTIGGVVYLNNGAQLGSAVVASPFGIIRLEEGVMIGTATNLLGTIEIGAYTRIGKNCTLYSCEIAEEVIIEDSCYISEDVTIETRVEIGSSVDIHRDVEVQAYARIGSDSVLTKDFPAHTSLARGTVWGDKGASVSDSADIRDFKKSRDVRRVIKAHKVLDSAMKKYRARNGRDFKVQDSKVVRPSTKVRSKLFDSHGTSGVHFIKKI